MAFLANFICIFLIPAGCLAQKTDAWELKKDESEIKVYSRKSSTAIRELKSEMIVKGKLSSAVAVLNDWDKYTEWVYRCDSSATLKKLNGGDCIHYQSVEAPWPVTSRDFVVYVTVRQDATTKEVVQRSVALPDYIPAHKDRVRIKNLNATWTVTPLPDGELKITYQMLIDPGGSVPAWLINLASVEGPFSTMEKLRARMSLPQYQNVKLGYIVER